MKVYVVIDNNHSLNEDYIEWISNIYSNKQSAKKDVKKCLNVYWQQLQNDYALDGDDLEYNQKFIQKTYQESLKYTPVKIEVFELDCSDGKIN